MFIRETKKETEIFENAFKFLINTLKIDEKKHFCVFSIPLFKLLTYFRISEFCHPSA